MEGLMMAIIMKPLKGNGFRVGWIMPKKYEAIRDKFKKEGMGEKEAKKRAAMIYNATRKKGQAPVTGKKQTEKKQAGGSVEMKQGKPKQMMNKGADRGKAMAQKKVMARQGQEKGKGKARGMPMMKKGGSCKTKGKM